MKRAEFLLQIDALIQKANKIDCDDFSAATSVIQEFQKFVEKHSKYLNQYALEHIGTVQAYFDDMKRKKNWTDKVEAWRNGCSELIGEIEALKEGNLPDEIED